MFSLPLHFTSSSQLLDDDDAWSANSHVMMSLSVQLQQHMAVSDGHHRRRRHQQQQTTDDSHRAQRSHRCHHHRYHQADIPKSVPILQFTLSQFCVLPSWLPVCQNRALTFFSLILLQCLSTISCIDSFNDLEKIRQTSLCDGYGANALGMESGTIPDSALSASSSYNEQSVGPQNARLNRELNGGAWCPANQIDANNSGKEWIQINFTEPYVITKVATQGRFGNGMGVEFAEQFLLHYTRDGIAWIQWRNQYGEYEIQGNVDTYSIVESVLSVPLVGVTAMRLLPISRHTRTCCVRFEVYGCPYKDGPISYSMIDGDYEGKFGDLIDDTYDGYRRENGYLSDGLGQLVDGLKGDDDYKVNKGFEWIGWQSTSHEHGRLSIVFEFADIRNFTLASFHCNNMFTKDMQVFHSTQIWFSLDGSQWAPMPEKFEYMPDNVVERARDVVIHLHHRVGRFIKFDLKFASRWLLISEVRFDSRPIMRGALINEFEYADFGPITTTAINSNSPINKESVLIVTFAVIGFLLIIFTLFFFLSSRKRKEKITGVEYTTVPMKDVSTPLYCEPHDFSTRSPFVTNLDPEYAVPDIVSNGAETHTIVTLNGTKTFLNGNTMSPRNIRPLAAANAFAFLENQKQTTDNDDGKARYYASTDVFARNNLASYEQIEPSNMYESMESEHNPSSGEHLFVNKLNSLVCHTPPPPLPLLNSSQLHCSNSPPSSLSSNSSRLKNQSAGNTDSLESYSNTQARSLSTKTPSPMMSQYGVIPMLKDTELSVIDGHFGYSKFGDCELGYLALKQHGKQLVILKTLSNEQFRDEFLTEMSEKWRLSSQCCDKFASFYGYISKHDYLAMVIEYGDLDLKKFLRSPSASTLRLINLIEIATQVAEAMQELHSRGFIHRDLAARNCLIYTSNYKVKITDSGAFIADYKTEYFNEVLPVRWMSYESILHGRFTNKSDVYSFGVTLWEIMNYCKILPHENFTEEQLINEMIHDGESLLESTDSTSSTFYKKNPHTHHKTTLTLPQNVECPTEIYDLILECCQLNENSRPEFYEIAYFLKKKCLSFRKIQLS